MMQVQNNPFEKSPSIVKMRFCRVIFGTTCSQYLLTSIIQRHSDNYKNFQIRISISVNGAKKNALHVSPTKRNILKVIASAYELIGFLQPNLDKVENFISEYL